MWAYVRRLDLSRPAEYSRILSVLLPIRSIPAVEAQVYLCSSASSIPAALCSRSAALWQCRRRRRIWSTALYAPRTHPSQGQRASVKLTLTMGLTDAHRDAAPLDQTLRPDVGPGLGRCGLRAASRYRRAGYREDSEKQQHMRSSSSICVVQAYA
jgi:hypothetical protein